MRALFGDAEVMRHGDGPQDDGWIAAWIEGQVVSQREHGCAMWAVCERGASGDVDDTPVGYAGLNYHPDFDGRRELALGYRLVRRVWGRGLATEAVRTVLAHADDELGLRRVVATIDPHNPASLRVAEKAGMRYERDVMLPGYDHPDRLYAIEFGGPTP